MGAGGGFRVRDASNLCLHLAAGNLGLVEDEAIGHEAVADRDAAEVVGTPIFVCWLLRVIGAQVIGVVGVLAFGHLNIIRMQLLRNIHMPLRAHRQLLRPHELVIILLTALLVTLRQCSPVADFERRPCTRPLPLLPVIIRRLP